MKSKVNQANLLFGWRRQVLRSFKLSDWVVICLRTRLDLYRKLSNLQKYHLVIFVMTFEPFRWILLRFPDLWSQTYNILLAKSSSVKMVLNPSGKKRDVRGHFEKLKNDCLEIVLLSGLISDFQKSRSLKVRSSMARKFSTIST